MSTLHWGRYEGNQTPIGGGSQGKLFKGFDPVHRRTVAVKESINIERAQREASAMMAFGTHKHLTQFYDFFILNNKAYLILEWIEGHSLNKNPQKYDEKKAVRITLNLLDGLKHLHEKGFLHRDIMPNNVMLTKGMANTVKLIDFGSTVKKGPDNIYQNKHSRKRNTFYCPPEQRRSEWWVLDDSSDLYRVAGICFFLLTAKIPELNSRTGAHRCLLKNKSLEKILNKAMDPTREKRFRNAGDMIKALKGFA